MDSLIRTTPYFVLLSMGIVTLLLIMIHMRNLGLTPHYDSSGTRLPGVHLVFPLVLMLGFLIALSGALGLVGLGIEKVRAPCSSRMWLLGQKTLEIFVKLALGCCILYLFDNRVLPLLFLNLPMDGKILVMHNACLAFFLVCSTTLYFVSLPIPIPVYVPPLFTLIACWLPLPLLILLARGTMTPPTVQPQIWVTLILVQLSGGLSSCFAMISTGTFAIVHAVFLAFWVGGMMTVFQFLYMPLNIPPYQTAHPMATVSEDFLSLRDPFMTPPPLPPNETLSISPLSISDSQHSPPHVLAGMNGTQHITRKHKSTSSLPRTSPNLHVAIQTPRKASQANSRQRRINSEPLLPLMLSSSRITQQQQPHFPDSGDEDPLDRAFLSRIIIYPTGRNGELNNSTSSSIAETTDCRWYDWSPNSPRGTSPHTMIMSQATYLHRGSTDTQQLTAGGNLEASEVEAENREEQCDLAPLEGETIRPRVHSLGCSTPRPCSTRPQTPNP